MFQIIQQEEWPRRRRTHTNVSRADLCFCNTRFLRILHGDNDSAAEQEDGGHHVAGTQN